MNKIEQAVYEELDRQKAANGGLEGLRASEFAPDYSRKTGISESYARELFFRWVIMDCGVPEENTKYVSDSSEAAS